MVNLKDYHILALQEWFVAQGKPKFRAAQVFEWLYKFRVRDYLEMTNLPKELRQELQSLAPLYWPKVARKQVSKVDGTRKILLELGDGNFIESVLIPQNYGNSICVSSQVGCALACSFCATGISGFIRNLTVGEMVDQVLAFESPISSLVMMGMGEPMLNLDRVLEFAQILHDKHGFNLGYRHMTISTSGIPNGIRRLAESGFPITLALSLHAPNDQLRSRLMPINKKHPIASVLEAADYYAAQTGRRYTLEYALIAGVNDSRREARELATLAKGRLTHINLIPVNDVNERNFKRSSDKKVENFSMTLEAQGIPVTVRKEMGSDIDAACGQLRSRVQKDGQVSKE